MSPRAVPLPPDERRAEIIRAARPLLVEHGGRFTTREVAEAAGIAEGTLFRVFATKRDLMHAVISDAMDPSPLCATLDAIDRTQPLAVRTMQAVVALQRAVADVSAIFGALFTMPADDMRKLHADPHRHHDLGGQAARERQAEALHDAIRRVLAPDEEALACTLDEAASMLRAMAFSTTHPHLSDGRLTDAATLTRLLLGGIAPTVCEETPC